MKKILVVDDDETILTFLQFFLSKEGHQVLLAKDGLAAQEIIKKEVHFDLIIVIFACLAVMGFNCSSWLKKLS